MNEAVALALMVLGGATLAFQAPINARLSERVGPLPTVGVSMAVGTLLLGVAILVTGKAGGLTRVGDVSPIYLMGGVAGAIFVLTTTATVRRIGAGGLSGAVVTGQLAAAVLIVDGLGMLWLDTVPVTVERLAGIGLLVVGALAVVSRR